MLNCLPFVLSGSPLPIWSHCNAVEVSPSAEYKGQEVCLVMSRDMRQVYQNLVIISQLPSVLPNKTTHVYSLYLVKYSENFPEF